MDKASDKEVTKVEGADNPEQSPVQEFPKGWSTPTDVKILLAVGAIFVGYALSHGVVVGFAESLEFFATWQRRAIFSALVLGSFLSFCLYLIYRKPYWRGWRGIKGKLERPKPRHFLYALGIFTYAWLPLVPGLMPTSPLERAARAGLPTELHVLEEKIRIAHLHYLKMLDAEERAEKFATMPRAVQLSMRPPLPYAGLADRIQADLPHFTGALAQRADEMDAAGLKTYGQIFRRLAETEDHEREVLVLFRSTWQTYADMAAWTTRIAAYRKAYRYLILGNYVRALRDIEPELRSIGIPPIESPPDLEILDEKLDPSELQRINLGIPPQLEKSDFIPAQLHVGHPMLR